MSPQGMNAFQFESEKILGNKIKQHSSKIKTQYNND
jgi:hypothetical protein